MAHHIWPPGMRIYSILEVGDIVDNIVSRYYDVTKHQVTPSSTMENDKLHSTMPLILHLLEDLTLKLNLLETTLITVKSSHTKNDYDNNDMSKFEGKELSN